MAIDLAQDYSDMIPSGKIEDKHYPSFHVECDEDLELPEEGGMTITFKRRGQTARTDKDGNCTYSYDIEVCTIEEINDEEVEETDEAGGKSYDDAGSAIDKILEELKKKA